MNNILTILEQSYLTFFDQLAAFIPKLLGALVILIIGWLIAKIIKTLIIKLLGIVRFEKITEKSKVDQFLQDGGIKSTAIQIIGSMFYWLIILIVILAAFDTLGITGASELFNEIILFIPNIIVASFILIFGFFLATVLSQVAITYLSNIKVKYAEFIGGFIQYAFILFVISVTLTQLNIGREIITIAFLLIFGAVCLAFALAFGLGARGHASDIVEHFLKESTNTDNK
ncbi:MAG: hypothetical protein WD097_01445 [Balneolales bacterium]